MQEVEKAANKLDRTVKELERRFKDGQMISDVGSFKHFAKVWFEFGHSVGSHERKESEDND